MDESHLPGHSQHEGRRQGSVREGARGKSSSNLVPSRDAARHHSCRRPARASEPSGRHVSLADVIGRTRILTRQRVPFPGPSVPVRGPAKYCRALQSRAVGQRNDGCTHAELGRGAAEPWGGLGLELAARQSPSSACRSSCCRQCFTLPSLRIACRKQSETFLSSLYSSSSLAREVQPASPPAGPARQPVSRGLGAGRLVCVLTFGVGSSVNHAGPDLAPIQAREPALAAVGRGCSRRIRPLLFGPGGWEIRLVSPPVGRHRSASGASGSPCRIEAPCVCPTRWCLSVLVGTTPAACLSPSACGRGGQSGYG